jgi:hypothetical protein
MLMRGLPPWRAWKGGYHHDEEEDLLLGAGAPPKGAAPSSPIKPPLSSKFHTLFFFPSPAELLPQIRLGLAKLCRIVSSSFTHLEKWVLECPADPFFRCPAGPRAWRRRRQAIRVTEYGGAAGCGAVYTISWSSSEPLRRLCQVNDYVDYVHIPQLSIGNVCAGT